MRGKHHAGQRPERLGHVGLIGEDVERGTGDTSSDERLHQLELVHDRAAGDVDEHTVGPERIQGLAADAAGRGGACSCGDDQDLARCGQLEQARVTAIGHRLLEGVHVGDRALEAFEAPRDRLANPAEAENAKAAAGHRAAEAEIARRPSAGADEAVAFGDPAE